MRKDPIDFDSPLGISKKEWTKVLGANLILLIAVYSVAAVFTLLGNGFFLLNFHSEDIQRIEEMLRSIGLYPIVMALFSMIETTIIACYVCKSKPKWWLPLGYLSGYIGLNVLFTQTIGYCPGWISLVLGILSCFIFGFFPYGFQKMNKWDFLVFIIRLAISISVSFALNGIISLFRTNLAEIFKVGYESSSFIALSIEYDLALGLALGFLTLLIPWRKKGGKEQCLMDPVAGGSSPTTTNSSPKNSPKKNNLSLSPKTKKRLMLLKVKVIAIQTVALIVIAALPIFAGKPMEFALSYVSFCLTRVILGFSHSLHFKSELSCVTIGALCFWGMTFLSPSAEASIIFSLVYGSALALGFRLYWELHDLMLYRKAAKTDRYAMFYVSFKTNLDPRHIRGVMKLRGRNNEDDIKMVQMYMAKEKVEYIADYIGYAKITVDKKLTEIAEYLYSNR